MITIGTFDIETSNLSADFGIILCGVVKGSGKRDKPLIIRGDSFPAWKHRRSCDRETVRRLRDAIDEFDVVVAHNGLKFDLPFIRTRLARWNLRPLPEKKIVDPLQLARNKLKMSWNSLDRLAEFLNVNSKSEVKGDYWIRAVMDGDRKAMNYIVDHCVQDVLTLERVVDLVKTYSTTFNSWGSGR